MTILCLTLCASEAGTLLDYTPPANPLNIPAISPGVPVSYASALTVGAQDVEVSSVSLYLDGLYPMAYSFSAYILSDSDNLPAALLGASERSFAPGELAGQGLAPYDFPLLSPILLSANGTYWVGFGTPSAGYPPYIGFAGSLEWFTGYGVSPSLTIAADGYPLDGNWSPNASDVMTLVYTLQGSVIPEANLASLLLLGLLLVSPKNRFRLKRAKGLARSQSFAPPGAPQDALRDSRCREQKSL